MQARERHTQLEETVQLFHLGGSQSNDQYNRDFYIAKFSGPALFAVEKSYKNNLLFVKRYNLQIFSFLAFQLYRIGLCSFILL